MIQNNYTWDILNSYIKNNFSNCSSFPELCQGFGVSKDGIKKELWQVVKNGLIESEKKILYEFICFLDDHSYEYNFDVKEAIDLFTNKDY